MTLDADSGTLPDWLAHRASVTPDRLALAAEGREWTFAELDTDTSRLARQLADAGVSAGDRVATLLHNGALPVLLVHAVLRLGATLVPLNTRLAAPEIAVQLEDARPVLVVVETRTASLAAHARAQPPAPRVIASHDLLALQGRDDALLRFAHPTDHVLAVIYTSGTTGRPKGAMLTVGNFWWSAIGSSLNLGSSVDDRWLVCLPLFHVGGLSVLLRSAIGGFAAVVHAGFDAGLVNRALDEGRVTIVSMVAVMLQRLLDARGGAPVPATLRCVLLGGGPAPAVLLQRSAALRVPVVQTYGLTETASQVATLAPDDAAGRPGSAGRALYPNRLRILDPAASDGAGEIAVQGPVVMAGYLDRPDETARALRDGWLRTGDIGRLDDAGFLYVLDRRDDLIVSGGENVYPAEVEAALLAHPMVVEAGVVGAADEAWGQRVVAVVRIEGTVDHARAEDLLREHCRAALAPYKSPREWRFVTGALPRTASGKLRRSALRESIATR